MAIISELLRVKQETLLAALTAKRARASGETLVINYRLPEAIAARDAMAKCLYGALFDWIVLQVNHALLSKKDTLRDHQGNSIGVLDIFGFEDFKTCNSFEQLCINYANEQLQHYFNQHVFQYEQREYRRQSIRWTDIGYSDNSGCLNLIEGKPNGLLCLLDDQCKLVKCFRILTRDAVCFYFSERVSSLCSVSFLFILSCFAAFPARRTRRCCKNSTLYTKRISSTRHRRDARLPSSFITTLVL